MTETDNVLVKEYFNLANYLYERGMIEEAMKCYEKVIKLDPKWAPAYYSLGSILISKGELDEAKGYLKKALQLEPNVPEIYWNMAVVLSRQALFNEAKIYWQKAVDLKPDIVKTETTAWEYLNDCWPTTDDRDQGYDTQDRIDKLRKNWDSFLAKYKGTKPLGSLVGTFNPATPNNLEQNIFMTYASILGLANRKKEKLSILDWGGGCGDYYLISKALFPEVQLDYHIKELPLVCQAGRELLPEVSWSEDEKKCFERSYDLVLVSGSLQYSQNWQSILKKLNDVCNSYLYFTRIYVVHQTNSYVVIQRISGINAECLCWVLNSRELLNYTQSLGMKLVREFLIDWMIFPHKAPEPFEVAGFLFRPETGNKK